MPRRSAVASASLLPGRDRWNEAGERYGIRGWRRRADLSTGTGVVGAGRPQL